MSFDLYPPPDPRRRPDPNQPQDPYPYRDPYQPPHPQATTVYVPAKLGTQPLGAGVAPLAIGIAALVLFAIGLALSIDRASGIGGAFMFLGSALAVTGTPLAVVSLVRRVRAKVGLGVSIAAVAANGSLVTMLLMALISVA